MISILTTRIAYIDHVISETLSRQESSGNVLVLRLARADVTPSAVTAVLDIDGEVIAAAEAGRITAHRWDVERNGYP